MFDLSGKVAVITGAAAGIGLATARRFHAAGATVVLSDLVDATDAARQVGGVFIPTDVSDPEQVRELVGAAVSRFGRLDIMVNNVGVLSPESTIADFTPSSLDLTIDVNLKGVLYGMRFGAEVMLPGSAIVNTASMGGIVGFPSLAIYGASKFAVVGLTKNAAIEFGPSHIRVNCVCPIGVQTEMTGSHDHWASRAQALGCQDRSTLAAADDIAAGIHFLASDDAAMVNGHALFLDGGLAAGLSEQLIEKAVGEAIRTDAGRHH